MLMPNTEGKHALILMLHTMNATPWSSSPDARAPMLLSDRIVEGRFVGSSGYTKRVG